MLGGFSIGVLGLWVNNVGFVDMDIEVDVAMGNGWNGDDWLISSERLRI